MMQAGVYAAMMHYLKAVERRRRCEGRRKVVAKMKEMRPTIPCSGKGHILANGRKVHEACVRSRRQGSRNTRGFLQKLASTGRAIRPSCRRGKRLRLKVRWERQMR